MIDFYKHFKKSDSFMHIYWVRHGGHGFKPRLSINDSDQDIHFYFLFTWWKLEWYWCKGLKKGE